MSVRDGLLSFSSLLHLDLPTLNQVPATESLWVFSFLSPVDDPLLGTCFKHSHVAGDRQLRWLVLLVPAGLRCPSCELGPSPRDKAVQTPSGDS